MRVRVRARVRVRVGVRVGVRVKGELRLCALGRMSLEMLRLQCACGEGRVVELGRPKCTVSVQSVRSVLAISV